MSLLLTPRWTRLPPVEDHLFVAHLDPSFFPADDDPCEENEPAVPARRRSEPEMPEDAGPPPPPAPPADDEPLPLWGMKITQPAYRGTLTYLLGRPPEAAGILLGPADDDVLVTHFVPDESGRGTAVSFELNAAHLNRVLKRVRPAGLDCKGLVHSHPAGIPHPSSGDVAYFRKLFAVPANRTARHVFVPIVCGGRLFNFAFAHGDVFPAELTLV
jgi:proteasome lid subunit RPN8/RPN11